jgi:Na+/proline symporter
MATSAVERSLRLRHRDDKRSPEERLRRIAVVFAVAVAVHGADHLRRGVDVITTQVTWAGSIQFLLAAIALVLVFRRHPWAPFAAIAIGFSSAIGFTAAHLLPHWSSFSDSFTGSRAPNVTVVSWATAVFEIGADIAFGWAGVRVFGSYGRRNHRSAVPRSVGWR